LLHSGETLPAKELEAYCVKNNLTGLYVLTSSVLVDGSRMLKLTHASDGRTNAGGRRCSFETSAKENVAGIQRAMNFMIASILERSLAAAPHSAAGAASAAAGSLPFTLAPAPSARSAAPQQQSRTCNCFGSSCSS
jgi:hypothetical protein